MKALALSWVVLNHIVERAVGGAAAGNLSDPWPPFAQRVAELGAVRGAGSLAWPLAVVRDFAWFGDQGVTVLFLVSGFGLAYGAAGRPTNVRRFYARRLARIYPTWWGAHLLFWPSGFLVGWGLFSGDWRFFASLLGFRALPSLFYYFAPAWWYVGTLIQLYLVFPLLYRFALARGSRALLAGACAIGFASLAAGPAIAHGDWLDLWQRGAFAVTQLPEFAAGIALGLAWRSRGSVVARAVRSPAGLAAASAVYALGTVLSLSVAGEVVAPLLLGLAATAAIFALAFRERPARRDGSDALGFVGRHSYAIYLVHQPFVVWFGATASALSFAIALRFVAGAVAALVATAIASVALERGTDAATRTFGRLRARRGPIVAAAAGFAAFALLVVVLPVSADLAVGRFAPEEVSGWGERASLEPDLAFGWKMRPGETTRLRWVTYDYTVSSNALGFPAPGFPERKAGGAIRILVTGDAFSSAEGVDTQASWPRFMQADLARDVRRPAEVLNFAVTGYGPKQEAAVVKAFASRFRPDLVLVEMFANDVGDALLSDDDFRASIGFTQPPQTGLKAVLTLRQLRAAIGMRVVAPLLAKVHRRPTPEGSQLGNLPYVETGARAADLDSAGVAASVRAYRSIAASARAAGAKTLAVFVPPSVSVCDVTDFDYLPASLDLHDASRYDLTLPASRAKRIATAAGVPLVDLTDDLRALRPCPFVRRNMHFTPGAHRAIAEDVARAVEAALER